MQYLPFIVSIVSGGLAGAVVNYLVTRRRQRVEVGLKVIDFYFANYNDIAKTKYILQNPTLLADGNEKNQVLKIGNWFELVASLCTGKAVDTHLLAQTPLFLDMSVFRSLVKGTFNQSRELLDAETQWWPELYK